MKYIILQYIRGDQIHTSVEERVGAAIGKGCTFADNVIFHTAIQYIMGTGVFLFF